MPARSRDMAGLHAIREIQRHKRRGGTIIARLAWKYVESEENDLIFGRRQSWIAGDPTDVQLMVKDSTKYATSPVFVRGGVPDRTLPFRATPRNFGKLSALEIA